MVGYHVYYDGLLCFRTIGQSFSQDFREIHLLVVHDITFSFFLAQMLIQHLVSGQFLI